MAKKVSGGATAVHSSVVTLKDRYDIHTDRPLPEFDSMPAVCYAVTHKRDSKRILCAYICDPKQPPRHAIIGSLHRVDHSNFMRVVNWDVVDWPPEGRRCPAIIVERPKGLRVFPDLRSQIEPWSEERVTEFFLEPLAQVLRDIHSLGLTHRNIRPDNLFYDSDDQTEIVLGECYTGPVAITQNIVYETVEAGLAAPGGRGEGTPADDMYALGVTLVALLTGISPGAGWSDEDVLKQKLMSGSYGALVQHHRVSLSMMEPIRGLLSDTPMERWSLNDLNLWLSGRRLSPAQQKLPTKATRNFRFANKEHVTVRELAQTMSKNWDEAMLPVTDGSLDGWMRRSVGDDDLIEAVGLAKGVATGSGLVDETDRMIGRLLIAMDPAGPIRFKEFSATVSGIPNLIGLFASDAKARQLFVGVLNLGLIPFWLELQAHSDNETLRFIQKIERLRGVLRQSGMGFGIERVIYELNEGLPCLSPMFDKDYVPHVESVLPAIERALIGRGAKVDRLFDRDIAAFVARHANNSEISTSLRNSEGQTEGHNQRLAQVYALAVLQSTYHKKSKMTSLCEEMVKFLEPTLKRFYSDKTREIVRKELKKASKTGDLKEVLIAADNQQLVEEDSKRYRMAINDYAKTVVDLAQLKHDIKGRNKISEEIGGQIATALAGLIATIGSIVVLALKGIT